MVRYGFSTIKIIGGKFRGRKIFVSKSMRLRPTLSKYRGMLFNWLNPFIYGSYCLDCFSGSGAFAIEAISRNACFVTLVELNYLIFNQIKRNLNNLNIENTELILSNTIKFLSRKGSNYDIVFLDPPFNNNFIKEVIFLLSKNRWLKKGSLVYIEQRRHNKLVYSIFPDSWKLYKEKYTKNISFHLYLVC